MAAGASQEIHFRNSPVIAAMSADAESDSVCACQLLVGLYFAFPVDLLVADERRISCNLNLGAHRTQSASSMTRRLCTAVDIF